MVIKDSKINHQDNKYIDTRWKVKKNDPGLFERKIEDYLAWTH
jgi:hypothetical protein